MNLMCIRSQKPINQMKLSIITKSKIKIKIKKITIVYNKMPSSHLSQQHFYFVVMTKM